MVFVLVHGAFQGGWCWKRLRKVLVDAGSEVFVPSLTGLGDRSHLLSPDIGLEVHIRDISDLLTWEDLRDVILVGHSYGGMVISGACELAGDRIRHLVYLDALAPKNGQSNFDILDEPVADLFRKVAVDGWRMEVPADVLLPYLGIDKPEDRSWFEQRLSPQPLRTFEQPFRASSGAVDRACKTFIHCTNPSSGPAYDNAAKLAQVRAWGYYSLPTAHEAMWTMPNELANILLSLDCCSSPQAQSEVTHTPRTWTS